ncbi:MAG: hypothetical protein ACR2HD_07995 [Solirubrobacteraceae bacterium]
MAERGARPGVEQRSDEAPRDCESAVADCVDGGIDAVQATGSNRARDRPGGHALACELRARHDATLAPSEPGHAICDR